MVLFSTGDQELMFASGDTDNFIVSLTEDVSVADDGTENFVSKVNWYKRFENGKRVTGPMVLFSSQLYAATFAGADPDTEVCGGGTSTVWAMHFLNRAQETDPSAGGEPLWKVGTTLVQEKPVDEDNPDTVVFGLTLAQEPNCLDETAAEIGEDPFIAFGVHTKMSGLNPGAFKLIMHTGSLNSADVSADAADNTKSITLETPSSITRVDSWAAIVE